MTDIGQLYEHGDVHEMKSAFILIRSSSYLQVTRTGIKYRMSSISGQIE